MKQRNSLMAFSFRNKDSKKAILASLFRNSWFFANLCRRALAVIITCGLVIGTTEYSKLELALIKLLDREIQKGKVLLCRHTNPRKVLPSCYRYRDQFRELCPFSECPPSPPYSAPLAGSSEYVDRNRRCWTPGPGTRRASPPGWRHRHSLPFSVAAELYPFLHLKEAKRCNVVSECKIEARKFDICRDYSEHATFSLNGSTAWIPESNSCWYYWLGETVRAGEFSFIIFCQSVVRDNSWVWSSGGAARGQRSQ